MSLVPVRRADLTPGLWDRFVFAHRDGWFFHTEAWIRYALAYTPGSTDDSTALCFDGKLVAVIPGISLGDECPYGGQPTVAPLLTDEVEFDPGEFPVGFRMALRPGRDADDIAIPSNGVVSRETTYVVDLWDGDELAHWRRLRKSYRALIHRAEQEYDLTVVSNASSARYLIGIAMGIHAEVAGRRTRYVSTWDLMADWCQSGHGVLAMASKDGQYVGFAYAIRWKEWSYWMSGATLSKDLQHALQWHLMKALMCDGETRYYEIGHAARCDEEDKKAKNIAFFKSGFGGTEWAVPVVESCQ